MRRAARGLDTPAGTIGQEVAAEKLFEEFLMSMGLSKSCLDDIHRSHSAEASLPTQNFYSLLTAFSIFIQTRKSERARSADGYLAKATALGYFSQVVNLLRERYTESLSDSKRIAKIRDKMASHIEERNLRANVQTSDAPGCTVDDLSVLVEYLVAHADVATGLKCVHDAALLTMMWHTFGRAIDTCFARKQQLSIAASGELFLHIARIKTSVVQGVSIYKSPHRWQQCMFHAFGLLFICSDEPSEHIFPLTPRFAEPDLPGGKPYSQDEAIMYWENLLKVNDCTAQPPQKRERKRPNVASYITEIIRDTVKAMPLPVSQTITPHMTSHSLRRGAAAYANASPKLSIQWISTRGAWLLESLTKAFAYIGTTSKEDQSVGKVLAGYQTPDLPVTTPSIRDLEQRLSVLEYGQLITLRDELYHHVLGFEDVRFNVALDVVDATFASLLIHLESVLKVTDEAASSALVSRYRYELERGVAATNARLGCNLSVAVCCKWGGYLTERWRTANHAHVSGAVSGGDTVLTSTLENVLSQLTSISDRLGRVEDALASAASPPPSLQMTTCDTANTHPSVAAVPAPATSSTLAGSFLNWYTNSIWETVKGKKEQNRRADAKAAINIMLVLYQAPCAIPAKPAQVDAAAYKSWKHAVWTLAVDLDKATNERLHAFDSKKATSKVSSLRKRWRSLRASHPDAYRTLGAQYIALKNGGQIVDGCTPLKHQWMEAELT